MPLEAVCESYLGKIVTVKPVYGWGWTRIDAPQIPVPMQINGVPYPFGCRLKNFIFYQDELSGAVGSIEEPGHIYDELWIFFYYRTAGTFNFTDNPPYCNLEIGPAEPQTLTGEWPEFTSGSPRVNGYAFVGESTGRIETYLAALPGKTIDL